MTTGNHLTVRDYFDQALIGGTVNRKVYSSQIVGTDGNKAFHRMLTSQAGQRLKPIDTQPTGLTAVDYLRNPLRRRHRYNYQPGVQNSALNVKKSGEAADASRETSANDSAVDSRVGSQASRRPMQLVNLTASTSLPDQTGSNERRLIESSIYKAARKYNLSASLIKGVIRAESNFQVDAVSRAGAQGLMQLMPETARELGVTNPFDIEQNIDGGARYLREMLDSFGGDIEVALAAYNAGPGAVEKYGGQIPPYQETERYVERVLKFSKQKA